MTTRDRTGREMIEQHLGPSVPRQQLAMIEPELIENHPYQVRVTIDDEYIERLSESIRAEGLLQPLVVVQTADSPPAFRIVDGQCRLLAVKLLVITEDWYGPVPCRVMNMDDSAQVAAMLAANAQREQVDPIEEAEGIRKALSDIPGLTQKRVAEQLGISQSELSQRLSVIELPDEVLDMVGSGGMSWAAARELLVLKHGGDAYPFAEHAETIKAILEECQVPPPPNGRVSVARMRREIRFVAEESADFEEVAADSDFAAVHVTHRIDGDVYTCDVHELHVWLAERVTEEPPSAATESEPVPPDADWWTETVAGDALVKQVAPEFAADPRRSRLTEEDTELLGTRAVEREVTGQHRAIAAVGRRDSYVPSPPPGPYFDKTPCLTTCTTGAFYGKKYGYALLMCSNATCYDGILAEGVEKARRKAAGTHALREAERKHLYDALLPMTPTDIEVLRRMLKLMVLRCTGSNIPDNYRDRMVNGYREETAPLFMAPEALEKVRLLLKLEPATDPTFQVFHIQHAVESIHKTRGVDTLRQVYALLQARLFELDGMEASDIGK